MFSESKTLKERETQEEKTHHVHLHPEFFEKIRNAEKKFEFRKYDEKRKKMRVGDTLILEKEQSGHCIVAFIKSLWVYESVIQFCCGSFIGPRELGFEDWKSFRSKIVEIYGEDVLRNQKVVAIELDPRHEKLIFKGEQENVVREP